MAYNGSAALVNLRNGLVELVLNDGTRIELAPGDGDASIGESSGNAREALAVRNRGAVIGMVEGNDEEVSFSINLKHAGLLVNGAASTVTNGLLALGFNSAAGTIDPAGVVHTGNVVLTETRTGLAAQTITLANCRLKVAYSESAEGNVLAITGTAYGYEAGGVRVKPVTFA